jgi:methyl-accepting chemotaxis protein
MNSINKKVIAGYLVILFVAFSASAILFLAADKVKHQSNQFVNVTLPGLNSLQIVKQEIDNIVIASYALYGTTLKQAEFNNIVKESKNKINQALQSAVFLSEKESNALLTSSVESLFGEIKNLEGVMSAKRVDWDGARSSLAILDKHSNDLSGKLNELNNIVNQNTQESSNEINSNIGNILLLIIALLLGIITVTVMAYFYMRKSITNPIHDLAEKLDQVSQNFDLTVKVPELSKDEVGKTAKSISSLITAFNSGLKDVSSVASNISELVLNLGESSDVVDQQVKILHAKIECLVEDMVSLEQKIHQNYERSQVASDTARRGADEVHNGTEEVSKTSESIANLANEIITSSQKLADLKTSGDQVSMVVSTIAEIAEQTNLLALNAAIEAARAGESGRGFAVVADEIRTLANRTHDSTIEINTMLEKIVSSITTVVSSMEHNESEAQLAVELAKNTVDSLSTIKTTILALSEENEQAAAIANDSRVSVVNMRGQIDEFKSIGSVVYESSVSTHQNSSRMSELANNLNQSVDKFKI